MRLVVNISGIKKIIEFNGVGRKKTEFLDAVIVKHLGGKQVVSATALLYTNIPVFNIYTSIEQHNALVDAIAAGGDVVTLDITEDTYVLNGESIL